MYARAKGGGSVLYNDGRARWQLLWRVCRYDIKPSWFCVVVDFFVFLKRGSNGWFVERMDRMTTVRGRYHEWQPVIPNPCLAQRVVTGGIEGQRSEWATGFLVSFSAARMK